MGGVTAASSQASPHATETSAPSAETRSGLNSSLSPNASALAWTEEFEAANPEMTQSANQLFGTIEKPKFSNAEFLKFVNSFGGKGGSRVESDDIDSSAEGATKNSQRETVKLDTKDIERVEFSAAASSSSSSPSLSTGRQRASIADKWAAELESETQCSRTEETGDVQKKNEGQTSIENNDSSASNAFMEKLQGEWEDAGARVDRDWFKTFEHATNRRDAYAVYTFDDRNPFIDYEGDMMEEGRRRWRRGDLANAILLFEAAVKKGDALISVWISLILSNNHIPPISHSQGWQKKRILKKNR